MPLGRDRRQRRRRAAVIGGAAVAAKKHHDAKQAQQHEEAATAQPPTPGPAGEPAAGGLAPEAMDRLKREAAASGVGSSATSQQASTSGRSAPKKRSGGIAQPSITAGEPQQDRARAIDSTAGQIARCASNAWRHSVSAVFWM